MREIAKTISHLVDANPMDFRLKSTHGTIRLAIPQNSLGDWFLRRWAKRQKNSQDAACGFSIVCTGVTLQKVPNRAFDRTATNLTYTLPATTIAEQASGQKES